MYICIRGANSLKIPGFREFWAILDFKNMLKMDRNTILTLNGSIYTMEVKFPGFFPN